ncbi:MAG: zf-HC2 domain-containing protein, partial [Elusimicrobia bacterium]|nr:zf-HC2 domain-containing protein [Elusimicrobiota bacterium]
MNDHLDGEEISAFLDGALGGEDRLRADEHVASCGACRRELDSLRHLKRVLLSAPRRTLPADLALSLERRFVGGAPWWKAMTKPALWIPAGAVAASALAFSLWAHKVRAADELPFEPLLAAHERYSAESLVPDENLVAANYSDQMTAIYADAADPEL